MSDSQHAINPGDIIALKNHPDVPIGKVISVKKGWTGPEALVATVDWTFFKYYERSVPLSRITLYQPGTRHAK